MKKLFLAAVAAAVFCVAPVSAQAMEQDMAKISCKEFLTDQANMPMMIMWIDGYLSGKSDNTMVDDAWITKLGTHLGQYCSKNPGNTIMQAIDAMPN